jgi:hypothetical protein
MPDWITGGKSGRALADLKRARESIAALPSGNSLRALEEMTGWLNSISETPGLELRNRLEAVDLLDRSAKNHQFKLAPEYLEAPRLQKFYESRLWNTSFGFWKALGQGYLQCIEHYERKDPGSDALIPDLPMVMGRAARTLALQTKWILLRYGLIEERIWRDLGRAYLLAENQGLAARRAQIYPGKHGESTVQEEFLKAVMLMSSAPDGLAPVSVHIAERAVAHFARRFVLQPTPAGCSFCFDLARGEPPARVAAQAGFAPTVRFFGAGAAAEELRALSRVIREKDGVPADINLGGQFDRRTVTPVLKHLEQHWGDKIPERGAQRREIATRVTVVPGYSDTLAWVQAVADETSLEFSDPRRAESWIVFNASDGGYGAVVPQTKGDWLHVGGLVGLRTETSNLCRIGIVRRMTRDQYDQRRVGIQVLDAVTVPVVLSRSAPAPSAEGTRPAEHALLLSSRPEPQGEVALVLRSGTFAAMRPLHMVLAEEAYTLEPVELIEAGEDFDWARCRVTGKMRHAQSLPLAPASL